jgi:hypothetical protein
MTWLRIHTGDDARVAEEVATAVSEDVTEDVVVAAAGDGDGDGDDVRWLGDASAAAAGDYGPKGKIIWGI